MQTDKIETWIKEEAAKYIAELQLEIKLRDQRIEHHKKLLDDSERMYGKLQGEALKDVTHLHSEIDRLKEALGKIQEDAYPEKTFHPLDESEWIEFAGAVRSTGISLDRISADYGRTLLKPFQRIATEALKTQ